MLRNQPSKPDISSENLIEPLVEKAKIYLNKGEVDLIVKAFNFASNAHSGVFRVSGDIYLSHPLSVSELLADLKLDAISITAALLHDVVEDTSYTLEEIESQFGPQVAKLVDGVSRVEVPLENSIKDIKASSYAKLFMAMLEDVRVVFIKLADRLHNMRTIKWMAPDKRARIANETLEVYAPLAHRLGMSTWANELQDICLQVIHPLRYRVLREELNKIILSIDGTIHDCSKELSDSLNAYGIKHTISNRTKKLYSIYQKMLSKHLKLHEVYDLIAIRVMVDDLTDCYTALGIIHQLYPPILDNFKDYIAIPKANGYQSLHTVVQTNRTIRLEAQIRTKEMDQYAEKGIASHWVYKTLDDNSIREAESAYTEHYKNWFDELLKIHSNTKTDSDFFREMRRDIHYDDCFVFARNGKIIKLPEGSTVLDFAYSISSSLGKQAVSASVNQRLVAVSTKLKNGELVIVNTSDKAITFPSYLDMVTTQQAKKGVTEHLAEQNKKLEKVKRIYDFPECCYPIRGDKIVAVPQSSKDSKFFSVHKVDCEKIKDHLADDSLIYLSWQDIDHRKLHCKLEVAIDNVQGALAKTSTVISQTGIDIIKLQTDTTNIQSGGNATVEITLAISNRNEIAKLIRRLDKVPYIKRVHRV